MLIWLGLTTWLVARITRQAQESPDRRCRGSHRRPDDRYLQSGRPAAAAGRPLDEELLLPLPVVVLGVVVVVLLLPIWVVVLSRTWLVAASQHLP